MNNLEIINTESELEKLCKINNSFNSDMLILTAIGGFFGYFGNRYGVDFSSYFGYTCLGIAGVRALCHPPLIKREEKLIYELYYEPFEFSGFED